MSLNNKYIKIVSFIIGTDVLGFPNIHNHKLIYGNKNEWFKKFYKDENKF